MNKEIIFYTANRISDEMMNKNTEVLKKSAGDIPIISVSQVPMALGTNIVFDSKEQTYLNIYRQLKIGAESSNADIIYACEDDTFYSPSHFELVPKDEETFTYNMNKYSFFTWSNPPIFSNRWRKTLNAMIAPRKKVLEALQERFDLLEREGNKVKMCYWSEFGRNIYERHLGVKEQKVEEVESKIPIIMTNHERSINYLKQGTRKRLGDKRAYSLEFWGEARDFAKRYNIV